MRGKRKTWGAGAAVLFAATLSGAAAGLGTGERPAVLDGVGITEKLDQPAPLDLVFTDADGKRVTLRDCFQENRPVILTLNYASCPSSCIYQLDGLVEGVREIGWTPGENFAMVTVSMDPNEKLERTRAVRRKYLDKLGLPGAEKGWYFLVGEEAQVQALADAVGFGFAYDKDTGTYAHQAVAMVLMPDGRVARYLYGYVYQGRTLRLSLVEAADGKIGNTVDLILRYCYNYDPRLGRYSPVLMNIMRLGGVLTLLVMAATLGFYWLRESRRAARQPAAPPKAEA